ncbi:MAG: redoxin domain-containing protein [Planctomycetes bacterium]|nr:redoxin domain-containing protein [Planctomycetota bacterium]
MLSRFPWLLAIVFGVATSSAAVPKAGADEKKKEAPPILKMSGELKENDPKDEKQADSPSQKHKVKLEAKKVYQIDLKSKDFDSYLRLLDPKGKEVAFDDDGGGFPDARIVYKTKVAGEYTIVVTCFPDKTGKFMRAGKFNLTVVEDTNPPTNSPFKGAPVGELKLKDGKTSKSGEITAKDAAIQGYRYQVFTVALEKGKVYRVEHSAGDDANFLPWLWLENADGSQIEMADGSPARIAYKAIKTGVHRLVVTTKTPQQMGAFKLEIAPETDAKLVKEADLKYRINSFAALSGAQRKNLVVELSKRFHDKGEGLTPVDFTLAVQFSIEAEGADLEIAREVLKDYIKIFAGSSNKQIAAAAPRMFEKSLKDLDKLGKPMEVTGKLTNGKDFDLAKLKGKVVLVDFWATWCGPCIAELPNMERAYAKYHSKGFEIVGISLDRPGDEEKLTAFMESRDMPWPCINIEDSRKLANQYKVNAIPYPVLIDQAGNVVSFRARGAQLDRLLERLLGEKK